MANIRKTKAYQAALADILAVIDSAEPNTSDDRLHAVLEFIDSQSDMSESYRGYWIHHSLNKHVSDCFDVYLRQSDVGQVNHWACEESLDIARKVIDGYKITR